MPITSRKFTEMKKNKEKISMLTAYDYMWGNLASESGVDIILVGDSLGMVVLGYDTTLEVSMEDMISHSAAVRRGAKDSFIIADMPFMSTSVNDDKAVENAGLLMSKGKASGVKIEGGAEMCPLIRRIVNAGIPVCAHIGLMPQSVNIQGYRTQGGSDFEAQKLISDAKALEEAGVFAIVLEKIEENLTKQITESLTIPTIGIGSGKYCDGQVLVVHDILGLFDKFVPKFVKKYANAREVMISGISDYVKEVKDGSFPE